jgi:hypothetical protein
MEVDWGLEVAWMQISSRNMKSAMTRLTAQVQKVMLLFWHEIWELFLDWSVHLAVCLQKLWMAAMFCWLEIFYIILKAQTSVIQWPTAWSAILQSHCCANMGFLTCPILQFDFAGWFYIRWDTAETGPEHVSRVSWNIWEVHEVLTVCHRWGMSWSSC